MKTPLGSINHWSIVLASTLMSYQAHASVTLTGGSGVFQKFTSFFQTIIDFLGGSGTLFVIFLSAAAAIILWIIAPKAGSEALMWLFRVCMGAIGLFSLGLLITTLKAF
ncbi:hypothetical protein AB4458_25530 [Vibrio sp. 10N.261.45.F1]|uniref:hypothetical protein n=1 Tax=unclassified Vibrio TaxID=2614977 RepID=UPI0035523D5F